MKTVIIAFSNPLLANWMTTVLSRGGYTIEYACKTAGEVVRVADFCTSPVVVCGYQFSDMNAEDLLSVLDGRLAVLTVVLPHQRDLIERNDMPFVSYPVSAYELLQAVEHLEQRAALDAVKPSVAPVANSCPTERPAEEKLLILKAKGLLMNNNQMTESQAHRFLQKSSMDRGLKLIDAAKMVIENTLVV